MLYDGLLTRWFQWDYTKRGTYGDQFGALTCAFSCLSFIGLIAALMIQARALQGQTEDLQVQQLTLEQQNSSLKIQSDALVLQITEFKEQKAEMARSAEAQEQYNKLTKHMLWLEMEKLDFDRGKLTVNMGHQPSVDHFATQAFERHNELRKAIKGLLDKIP